MAVTLFRISLYTVLVFFPLIYSLEENLLKDSQHRIRRDVQSVEFEVNGKKFKFNFVLPDHNVYSRNAPVWLANSKPENSPNYTYDPVENSAQMVNGIFYVDNDKKAVVLAHLDRNQKKLLYDGLFGESKKQRIIESRAENRRTRTRSGRKNGDHVIYRSTSPKLYFPTPKHFKELFDQKLEKPLEQLYPKLLIVVDNHLFKKLGSDVAKTIKYVATFWTKVNQKYLEIESPKVNIMITGIIIANDEKALNFIYQSTLTAERTNGSVSDTLNENMRLYFHHEFPKVMDFQNYDAAVAMTGQNTHSIAGQAFKGKICGNWYNDAFVRDYADYSGIHTGIHELAHLLNVAHDPLDTSECAGFVAADKSASVMSPFTFETDNLFWSKCSKKSLQDFAAVKAAECLRDRHRVRNYDENMAE